MKQKQTTGVLDNNHKLTRENKKKILGAIKIYSNTYG